MDVDYKTLLHKYIIMLIAKDLIDRSVCPYCLNSDVFSPDEHDAMHKLIMTPFEFGSMSGRTH